VLCLGMSYPCVTGTLRRQVGSSNSQGVSTNGHGRESFCRGCVASLVQSRVLTEMDGRDLMRCQATEEVCGVDVFCVSLEQGAVYWRDRHLDANFNGRHFVKQLKDHMGGYQFDQIVLDYFWIPRGWDEDHWKRSFFSKTLVAFAEACVLTSAGNYPGCVGDRCRKGVIYLPFCFHCLKEIVALYGTLSLYYNVSFLRKGELEEVTLWAGTQSLDKDMMAMVFGKELSQEEIYCVVTEQQVRSMEDGPSVTKADVKSFIRRFDNLSEIRFIVLEILPLA